MINLSVSNELVGYFDPIQMPVSELLTGTYHFTIPSYQRGYRWESGDGITPNEETKQVDDLLNDLTRYVLDNINNSDAKPNYYLQPLMVKPRKNINNDIWEWEVLDGQQRLTTMLLILKCLKDKLKDNVPLYSIRYDNRDDLDFMRITYDENNPNFNYPYPNSNQDSYYVRKAKDRIEKWYEYEISSQIQLQDKLKEALFYPDSSRGGSPKLRVKFIWYNVEPISTDQTHSAAGGRIHDIKVFNRLNRGKIGLTDSELIKALFILCLKKTGNIQGSLMAEGTLVRKWDEMGQKFQDNSLWSMICPRAKVYQNRLDLLFDFILKGDPEAKEKRSYLYFYNKLNPLLFSSDTEKNKVDLEVIWNDVKGHFDKICKWHENPSFHNYVGYLVECGKSLAEIKPIALSIEMLKQEIKDSFVVKKKTIFDESGYPDIDELNYEDDYDVIKRLLLLFNVVTCDKHGQKFQFDSYRENSYDIEHINSQTENPIEKIEEKKAWVKEQALPCLMEDRLEKEKDKAWTQSSVQARSLVIEGIHLLKWFKENGDIDKDGHFKPYRQKVESYYAYGDLNATSVPSDRHSIGNLTLLNSSINREYKNALFPNKLKTLKRCDQEGAFIPLCTKYLFLKYYTNTSNTTSAFNAMRWRKEDQEDYLNAIKITLKNSL